MESGDKEEEEGMKDKIIELLLLILISICLGIMGWGLSKSAAKIVWF